jgi:DNA invertase Pin-like site-specific DNA recombinase
MATSKRVAFYARVSTTGQTTENQLRDLRKVAKANGWTGAATYVDKGISGSKGRDKRPQFDELVTAASRREFDLVAAWSVDRLGRSLQDLWWASLARSTRRRSTYSCMSRAST